MTPSSSGDTQPDTVQRTVNDSSTFAGLDPSLSLWTLEVLRDVLRFTHPTPVQEATIPLLLINKEVGVGWWWGCGDTLGFLSPVVKRGGGPRGGGGGGVFYFFFYFWSC